MGHRCARYAGCEVLCTRPNRLPSAPVLRLDEPTLIIDVRTAEEFAAGHFPERSTFPTKTLFRESRTTWAKIRPSFSIAAAVTARVRQKSACSRRVFRGKNVGGLNALLAATGRTAALPNH
ncbi:MAG: hypothetical protein CM15mP74_18620 [Halieaceae bacterium]|nr:MAG: hypothetical protein CM15mP74_18620 [Halieaceae bacterium]